MKRMWLVLGVVITGIFGSAHSNVARGAELKVLTSVALTSVLDELAPMFEKAAGTKLSID
jgi:ABC-type molybdate transport system substrate-binding protein